MCDYCHVYTTNQGSSGGGGGGNSSGECTCSGGSTSCYQSFTSVSDTQHMGYWICNTCGGGWRDMDENGNDCLYLHSYTNQPYTDNGDGKTHSVVCEGRDCGYIKTANHTDSDGDGECDANCGYTFDTHDCNDYYEESYTIDSSNGTHTKKYTCSECGESYTLDPVTHDYTATIEDNGDGQTHTATCECGDEITEGHINENGDNICDKNCGYEHNCDWENPSRIIPNDNDANTHILICVCKANTTEAHDYSTLTDNEDGQTHTAKCECGDEITVGHDYGTPVANEDGTTHTATCACGDEVTEGHTYVDGVCACGAVDDFWEDNPLVDIEISSEKYTIDETHVSKVTPSTLVSGFITDIETNATEVKIYDKDGGEVSEDAKLATGMRVELKSGEETKSFTIVVTGDINGDGGADFTDLVKVNAYRLGKLTDLEEAFVRAGDLTGDGQVDFTDLVKLNAFRLGKINL